MPTKTKKASTPTQAATTTTTTAKSRSAAAKKAAKTRKANAAAAASASGQGGVGVNSGAIGQQNLSAPPFPIPAGSIGGVTNRDIQALQKQMQQHRQLALAHGEIASVMGQACFWLSQGDSYQGNRLTEYAQSLMQQSGLVTAGS